MEQALSNRIAVFRNGHARMEQQLAYEQSTIARLTLRIDKIKSDSAELLKAVGLIDRCIELVSANGIGKIESIVSSGMHKVFQDDTLGLVVEKKETARGYSYRLLIQHGDTLGNPMDSFGGGIQNIAAFLLRVILIKRFKLPKLIVVDESFNNVSADNLSRVSDMLKTLAEDHGYTILVVTHQPKLAEAAKYIYEVVPKKPPVLIKRDWEFLSTLEAVDEDDKTEAAG